MVSMLLVLLLIAVGVAVLAAAGTVIIQGYLYSEPTGGVAWRSAAVGGVLGLFFGLWCVLEAKTPGQYDTLWNFTPRVSKEFPQFWSERTSGATKTEIVYKRARGDRGGVVYRDPFGQPWRRSDNGIMTAIVVEEDGQRHRFEAPRNADGTFRVEPGQSLQYVEVGGRGRVMSEAALGEVVETRPGLLAGNLLLNAAHLAVWFLAFWLLLRFQWPHALLLAGLFWLAFALTVWPVLKERVRLASATVAHPVRTNPAFEE